MTGKEKAATAPQTNAEGHFDMTELVLTVGRLDERIAAVPSAATTFWATAGGAVAVGALILGIAAVSLPREFDTIAKQIQQVEEGIKPLKASIDGFAPKVDDILETVTTTAEGLEDFSRRVNMLETTASSQRTKDGLLVSNVKRLSDFLKNSPKTKDFIVLAGSGADPADVVAAYDLLSEKEREEVATATMILGSTLMQPYGIRLLQRQ